MTYTECFDRNAAVEEGVAAEKLVPVEEIACAAVIGAPPVMTDFARAGTQAYLGQGRAPGGNQGISS